jgi:hypothetical protein
MKNVQLIVAAAVATVGIAAWAAFAPVEGTRFLLMSSHQSDEGTPPNLIGSNQDEGMPPNLDKGSLGVPPNMAFHRQDEGTPPNLIAFHREDEGTPPNLIG